MSGICYLYNITTEKLKRLCLIIITQGDFMKNEVHLIAAKEHLKIAEEYNTRLNKATDSKKEALRTVAAQNYFYALTNFIEARLSEKDIHSHDHKSRMKNMLMQQNLFSTELIKGYDDVSNIRGKVAYRAKNGRNYAKLRAVALLASKQVS